MTEGQKRFLLFFFLTPFLSLHFFSRLDLVIFLLIASFEARSYSAPWWARDAHFSTIYGSGEIQKKFGHKAPEVRECGILWSAQPSLPLRTYEALVSAFWGGGIGDMCEKISRFLCFFESCVQYPLVNVLISYRVRVPGGLSERLGGIQRSCPRRIFLSWVAKNKIV